MLIRFPEQLHKHPKTAISNEKEAEYAAMRPVFVSLPRFALAEPEDAEKKNAFQRHFIELGWMAWLWASAWKHHGPGDIGGSAEEFTVNKVP